MFKMFKDPHAQQAKELTQDPFAEQKQKMTMYFFVSFFIVPFLLSIFIMLLAVIFIPDFEEFCALNARFESTFDRSEVYTSDAVQAAFLEKKGVNVVLVSEEEARKVNDAMAAQISATRAEILPYFLYANLAYYLLSVIAYLLWLRVFLFERNFLGFKLGLKGARGNVKFNYKRLGKIAWALAWRGIVGWLIFCVVVLVCGAFTGIAGALIGGAGFFGSRVWNVLSFFVAFGIGIYSSWRICAFLVESLLKVEFSDFRVVFVQHVDRGMMSEIRKDLFEETPAVTMRMRLPTLEHWSGA